MTTKFRFTKKSSNKKTGPIPVTTTERKSCAPSCPLANAGCYGDGGPIALVWKQTETMGMSLKELCANIAGLPAGQLWRHNQVGDLPHKNGVITKSAIEQIANANVGKRGFTYTHHDMSIRENVLCVAAANVVGFTVNLSGNNPAHADELKMWGIAPVVTVLPADTDLGANLTTPDGHKITICPAVTGQSPDCATCKLCAIPNRSTIIGFPAHGMRKRAASEIASI
jgi:hypothetical protein